MLTAQEAPYFMSNTLKEAIGASTKEMPAKKLDDGAEGAAAGAATATVTPYDNPPATSEYV